MISPALVLQESSRFLLLLLWVCGQRVCVVQAKRHIHSPRFHNRSPLDFQKLKGDPDNIHSHLTSYINGFSANVRRIFDYFEFGNEIERMSPRPLSTTVRSR